MLARAIRDGIRHQGQALRIQSAFYLTTCGESIPMNYRQHLVVITTIILWTGLTFAQNASHPISDELTAAIQKTENARLHAYFSSSEIGAVAVLSVSEGGNACPAMFRIAYTDASGKYVLTKEFGDCSDIPTIIFEEKQVTLRFPGYASLSAMSEPHFRPPPPTTFVFSQGRLRRFKTVRQRTK